MKEFSFGNADGLQSAAPLKHETFHRFLPGIPNKVT